MNMACTSKCSCNLLTWDYLGPTRQCVKRRDGRKAGGILIYNGRVLIVQSRGNKWGFPKGGFEQGECALQCAAREVLEETSFNIRFSQDDLKIQYRDTTFYVKYLQNRPPNIDHVYLKKPGNDCTGIGWIRLTCLNKQVREKVLKFNMGVRNFVHEYIPHKLT